MALVLVSLVVILLSAKLGGALMERFRQPAVLGELVFGVILGNLSLLGFYGLDYLKSNEAITILAEIGVIFLLFEVGLESNIKEMLEVGISSFLVALVGVIVPMLLGWGVSAWFLPQASVLVHVFIGATLCATSVGITARVLKDLGKTSAKESRIILGAAVIDDVMGLVILAAIAGIIKAADRGGAGISVLGIGFIVFKAVAFLVIALWMGSRLSPRIFSLASKLNVHGMLLATSLCFCFLLSYLANRIELAPIVGAFAAGLILDPVHYSDFRERGEHSVRGIAASHFIVPCADFFCPHGRESGLENFCRFQHFRLRFGSDFRCHPWEAGLRPRGCRKRSGSAVRWNRNDPSRRSGTDLRQHWRLSHAAGKPGDQQLHLLRRGHHGDPDNACDSAPSQNLFGSWRSQEEVARPIENNGGSVKQGCRYRFAARRVAIWKTSGVRW